MHTGIVGFFDILGYGSLLKNSPEDAAYHVVTKLASLEETIKKELHSELSNDPKRPWSQSEIDEIVGPIQWLVFADTILLYTAFADADSHTRRSVRWLMMHFICTRLWRLMFDYGLPLRGVIHTGEFIVVKACIAGRSIIEAYEMTKSYEIAICVYSEPAFAQLVHHANEPYVQTLWGLLLGNLFEYQVPQKNNKFHRFVAVNPFAIHLIGQDKRYLEVEVDYEQVVRESFSKHNKDISESAEIKNHNTAQFLRAARLALGSKDESKQLSRFSSKKYFNQ